MSDPSADARAALYERNKKFAVEKKTYETPLDRGQETRFRTWLKLYGDQHDGLREFNPNDPTMDYDLRGWWLEHDGAPPPAAGEHFTDKYKTPYHPSFSAESMYANPETAPSWQRDGATWNLVTPDKQVLFSEPAK